MLALQSQVSEADGFPTFPVLRNADAQGQIIPQYEGTNFFHMQQMKKAVTVRPKIRAFVPRRKNRATQ